MSHAYQAYLGQGMTRSLVAMRAEESSTRTVGTIQLQLLNGLISQDQRLRSPALRSDQRCLDPPLDRVPGKLGVRLPSRLARTATSTRDGRHVTGATIQTAGGPSRVTADFYIAALPVEVMSALMTDELKRAAPSLANLDKLKTRWMNGIQFYLSQDEPVVNGHAIYLDSPWALTSISQQQFWTNVDLSQYRQRHSPRHPLGGYFRLGSARHGLRQTCAANAARRRSRTRSGPSSSSTSTTTAQRPIDDANLVAWFLDPDIEFPNPGSATNAEPLLINTAGSLQYRPEAQVELDNFFLASDYVQHLHRHRLHGSRQRSRPSRRQLPPACLAAPMRLRPQSMAARGADFLKPLQEIDRIRFQLGRPHHLQLLRGHAV